MSIILEAKNIYKEFHDPITIPVLKDINFQIQKGELIITKFDDVNQIMSGTFWFDAINKDGVKVEVREGRFDVHFIK